MMLEIALTIFILLYVIYINYYIIFIGRGIATSVNKRNEKAILKIQTMDPRDSSNYFVYEKIMSRDFYYGVLVLVAISDFWLICLMTTLINGINQVTEIAVFGIAGGFFSILPLFYVARYHKEKSVKIIRVFADGIRVILVDEKGCDEIINAKWMDIVNVNIPIFQIQGYYPRHYCFRITTVFGKIKVWADWPNIPLLFRDILIYVKNERIPKGVRQRMKFIFD